MEKPRTMLPKFGLWINRPARPRKRSNACRGRAGCFGDLPSVSSTRESCLSQSLASRS